MALYVTREGPFPTIDAWTNLTQFAGQTVNAITVPAGYGAIKELWVAVGPDGAATDATGSTWAVRLQGSGLKYGPVDIPVGGWAGTVTGNDSKADMRCSLIIPVDIALNAQGEIWVKGGAAGAATTGTPEMAVTCVFAKSGAGKKYYTMRDMSTAGATNTAYPATHSVDDAAAGKFKVPAGCTKITKLFGAFGGVVADNTGGSLAARLSGTGLLDGDFVIPLGGMANQIVGTGFMGGRAYAVVIPTSLNVVPGGDIALQFMFSGADVGTVDCAVGIEWSG